MCLFADCKWHETYKNCLCMSNYIGSEDMCKNDKCCNENCTQKVNDIAVCLPESRGRVLSDMGTGFLDENQSINTYIIHNSH